MWSVSISSCLSSALFLRLNNHVCKFEWLLELICLYLLFCLVGLLLSIHIKNTAIETISICCPVCGLSCLLHLQRFFRFLIVSQSLERIWSVAGQQLESLAPGQDESFMTVKERSDRIWTWIGKSIQEIVLSCLSCFCSPCRKLLIYQWKNQRSCDALFLVQRDF